MDWIDDLDDVVESKQTDYIDDLDDVVESKQLDCIDDINNICINEHPLDNRLMDIFEFINIQKPLCLIDFGIH